MRPSGQGIAGVKSRHLPSTAPVDFEGIQAPFSKGADIHPRAAPQFGRTETSGPVRRPSSPNVAAVPFGSPGTLRCQGPVPTVVRAGVWAAGLLPFSLPPPRAVYDIYCEKLTLANQLPAVWSGGIIRHATRNRGFVQWS